MFAPTHPMQLAFGFIIWSLWFVLMYSVLSIGCALSAPDISLGALNWLNALLLMLCGITTTLLVFLAWWCWRAPLPQGGKKFIARLGAGIYMASALSTLVIGLPVLVLPPCL